MFIQDRESLKKLFLSRPQEYFWIGKLLPFSVLTHTELKQLLEQLVLEKYIEKFEYYKFRKR